MASSTENKRLAKNTALLYVRTLLTIVISLYTARVILKELGVSDYGLFNAVGGMVAMFTVLNNALSGSSQRFLSFSLGRDDEEQITKTFRVLLSIHLFIALFFFVLLEVLGGLLMNNVLNIPEGRKIAAIWVFHLCAISVFFDMVRMLLDADIIANEKMDFYAYLSIIEVFLKLLIVFCIELVCYDKLIVYSFLYLLTTISVFVFVSLYCKVHFKEFCFSLSFDKRILKEVGSYSGWNTMSHASYMTITQGVNVALNVFLGTFVNAARGVAVQVNSIVTRLTNNFLIATMPQIVKLYAAGDINEMNRLVNNVSKYSFFLYLLFGLPLFLEIDFILSIWLHEVPQHTACFVRIFLIQGLIISISNPISRIISATGNVKKSNIFDSSVQIAAFCLIVLLLFVNVNVDIVMTFLILPYFLGLIAYLYLARIQAGFEIHDFFKYTVFPFCKVFCMTLPAPLIVYSFIENGWMRLIVLTLISSISLSISVFFLGIDNLTRRKVASIVLTKIRRV